MSGHKAKGSGLEWFVKRGSTVRGPFSSTRVRHYVLEGKLQLDDEVSADKQEWRRIGQVKEVVPLQMRAEGAELEVEEAVERRGDRLRAVRSIVIAAVLIVALTGLVMLVGQDDPTQERDCGAAPAPGVNYESCRLSGVDLRAASLVGANLSNASLVNAKLSEVDLKQANLNYVDLTSADLSYANLNGASLKGANLRSTDLTNADLSNADLSFADLGAARIGGVRWKGAKFDGAIWIDGVQCEANDCPR